MAVDHPAMTIRHRLAENLIRIRRDRSLSQADLAHQSGLAETLIAQIERSDYDTDVDMLEQLADALGVDIYVLLAPYAPE